MTDSDRELLKRYWFPVLCLLLAVVFIALWMESSIETERLKKTPPKVVTQTKTVTKQVKVEVIKPPAGCRQLTDELASVRKANLVLGDTVGSMNKAGDDLLEAMASGDQQAIVYQSSKYRKVWDQFSNRQLALSQAADDLERELKKCTEAP